MYTTDKKRWSNLGLPLITIMTTLALTGCYVDVYQEHDAYDADNDTDVYYPSQLTDFTSQFLSDAALIPFGLTMAAPHMVEDPDAYTTPRARNLSRALITDTTYAYLWDSNHCADGGYNETRTEADTTTYSDGYTLVELTMEAEAVHCQVRNNGILHTVDSNVLYQVTGWYDDWEYRLSSIDSTLTGDAEIAYQLINIQHRNMNNHIYSATGNDFYLTADSAVVLDDGFSRINADFETLTTVHYYPGAAHPHQGSVRFSYANQWTDLVFSFDGFWRTDDDGWQRFYSWNDVIR